MQDISQMNVENIVSRCSSMFWSGWYVGLCVCLSLSLCVLLFSAYVAASSLLTVLACCAAGSMQLLVCLSRPTAAHHCCGFAAVGRAGWKYRLITAAVACECGQCHIVGIRTLTLILWHWCWHYQWHCRLTNCVCVIDRCRRYSYVAVPGGWSSVRASDSDVDHTQLLTDSEILHALNQTTPLAHLNRRQVTFPHCTC